MLDVTVVYWWQSVQTAVYQLKKSLALPLSTPNLAKFRKSTKICEERGKEESSPSSQSHIKAVLALKNQLLLTSKLRLGSAQ